MPNGLGFVLEFHNKVRRSLRHNDKKISTFILRQFHLQSCVAYLYLLYFKTSHRCISLYRIRHRHHSGKGCKAKTKQQQHPFRNVNIVCISNLDSTLASDVLHTIFITERRAYTIGRQTHFDLSLRRRPLHNLFKLAFYFLKWKRTKNHCLFGNSN